MTFNAVIPTIGKSDLLIPLLAHLLEEGVRFVYLPDNSGNIAHGLDCQIADHPSSEAFIVMEAVTAGRIDKARSTGTIYQSWNRGMDITSDCAPLLVLNDDIILEPGAISECVRHLSWQTPVMGFNYFTQLPLSHVVDQDVMYVKGTYREGGLGGFAFAVLPNSCPRVDDRFRWWYGDDDLIRRVHSQGKRAGIALHAYVKHPVPSTSGNQMGWLGEAVAHDTELFHKLWARG